jgi:hypothetical protein
MKTVTDLHRISALTDAITMGRSNYAFRRKLSGHRHRMAEDRFMLNGASAYIENVATASARPTAR